jgi:hypothetical protein
MSRERGAFDLQSSHALTTTLDGCPMFAPAYMGRQRRGVLPPSPGLTKKGVMTSHPFRFERAVNRTQPCPLSSRPEESWAFGPTQGDEKRSLISNFSRWKRPSSLCHLDRRGHGPAGPPKVMKNGSCSATTVPGSTALPFVISTGAQSSGEICGPFLEVFFRQRNHGPSAHPRRRKTASVQQRLSPGSAVLPFVISTGAQRSGEISVWMLFRGNVFRQRGHGPAGPSKVMKNGSCSATTVPGGTTLPFVISTGAQSSGEICGQRSFLGNVFRQSVPGIPTLLCWKRPRVRLSVKGAACRSSKPRIDRKTGRSPTTAFRWEPCRLFLRNGTKRSEGSTVRFKGYSHTLFITVPKQQQRGAALAAEGAASCRD